MKLRGHQIFLGPSLWAPVPAIRLILDMGGKAGRSDSARVGAVAKKLERALPEMAGGLDEIAESESDAAAEPTEKPAAEPTPADLVARAALALQREFGFAVRGGSVAHRADGLADVVFEMRDPALALAAGRGAVNLIAAALGDENRDLENLRDTLIAQLRPRALDVATRRIAWQAERRGIPWLRLHHTERCVQVGHGHKLRRFMGCFTDRTSYIAAKLATSKMLAGDLLRANGIPTPRQIAVGDGDGAVGAARSLGFPVVVKPNFGDMSHGVSVNLGDEAAVRTAYQKASAYGPVLVEEHVAGASYRVTVVEGRMIAAGRELVPTVIGDGVSTVAALIETANKDPRRGVRDYSVLKPIEVDDDLIQTLRGQGLDLNSVPDEGVEVPLRRWFRAGEDYSGEDITDRIHPDNIALAERAARLIGLDVAGIDFISADLTRSVYDVGGVVNDVNPTPGLNTHIKAGAPDVLSIVLSTVFPEGENGRIPSVAVAGSLGAKIAARRTADILAAAGYSVGLATGDGVEIAGEVVARGDYGNVTGTRMILSDRQTSAAVIQTTPQDVAADGFGIDRISVAAVVDGGGEMAALRLLVGIAEDLVVLDAADLVGSELAAVRGAGRLCWISLDPGLEAVVRHIESGGFAVTLGGKGGQTAIHLWQKGRPTKIAPVTGFTAGNDLAEGDLRGALFAAAIAHGLGVPAAIIAARISRGSSE